MWTVEFWKDIAERFLWTLAQAAGAVFLVDGFDLDGVKVAVLAAALAFAKGLVANFVGAPGTAQLGVTTYEQLPETP